MPAAAKRRGLRGVSSADLLEARQQLALDAVAVERSDMAVADVAGAVDEVGLGHAVEAEIDADAAVLIEPDAAVGIAELGEEARRLLRLVLVGDAEERHVLLLGEAHQQRVLGAARHAPRGEKIDDRGMTAERCARQPLRARKPRSEEHTSELQSQ